MNTSPAYVMTIRDQQAPHRVDWPAGGAISRPLLVHLRSSNSARPPDQNLYSHSPCGANASRAWIGSGMGTLNTHVGLGIRGGAALLCGGPLGRGTARRMVFAPANPRGPRDRS